MSEPEGQHPRSSSSSSPSAIRILTWWGYRGSAVLSWVAVLMALTALVGLGHGTWRLLWQPTPMGAGDLAQRWIETRDMFAGRDVYLSNGNATYPPATMTMLWPVLSWPRFAVARVLWAIITAGALVAIVRVVVRNSGATTKKERRVTVLLPLVMYATGASAGSGQLTVPVVACLLVSLPVLMLDGARKPLTLAALALVAALAKPSLSAPFFWMVLFRPKRQLWAFAVGATYLGLTLVPGLAQPVGAVELCHQYLSRIGYDEAKAAASIGHVNVHTWLISLGRPEWNSAGSFLILGLLGFWTWRYRRADPWLLMGAAAFAARFWTSHAPYDDLILLIPMIALFRIAKLGSTGVQKIWAGSLLTAMLCSTIAPMGLYRVPREWNEGYIWIQVVVWLATCVFLLGAVSRNRSGAQTEPATPPM